MLLLPVTGVHIRCRFIRQNLSVLSGTPIDLHLNINSRWLSRSRSKTCLYLPKSLHLYKSDARSYILGLSPYCTDDTPSISPVVTHSDHTTHTYSYRIRRFSFDIKQWKSHVESSTVHCMFKRQSKLNGQKREELYTLYNLGSFSAARTKANVK
jgi:hypothetical protein